MKSIIRSLPRSRAELVAFGRELQSKSVVQSAFWAILGSGGGQAIRLASHLILVNLLAPEYFGIMALVTAVMVGLGQISDVGLREGVVNSDRINDPKFMATAWTLQIIKGGVIALLAIAISTPFAKVFNEPLLGPVLIVISLCTFITGFKSVAVYAYDKRLDIKAQMLIDLGVQVSGVIVTIVWASLYPSIWAFVGGQVFSAVLDVISSYVFFHGHNSRFNWDKQAVRKLIGFGKWILISSTISWITVQGDRVILGGFLTMGELGKYSAAATWAAIVSLVSVNLSARVLHPYFRQAIEHHSDYSKIRLLRNTLSAVYAGICVFLAIGGHWLVVFLPYPKEWIEVGWMLQILALGQIGRALTGTLMPFMLASGDSFGQMKFSACSAVILVVCLYVGGIYGGTPGVIFALAFASLASHPVMIFFAAKHGYRCLFNDMAFIFGSIALCATGWWLTGAPIWDVLLGLFEFSEIHQPDIKIELPQTKGS